MLSQYFAQYLLNNHLLNAEQICEALEEEQEHRVKLGVIAINQGLMTAKEVEQVHQLQGRFDKRFGEMAINEGLLNEEQVKSLLDTQESGNLNFGQAVLDKNFMTLGELENALHGYNGNNKLTIDQAIHQIEIVEIDFSEIEEVRELYSEYVNLFLRSLVRFLDTPAFILPADDEMDSAGAKWLISQKMIGAVGLTTGMLIAEDVLIAMAKQYSGEEILSADELAIDSVAEFLNVTNGLFIVNLSNRYLDIDLEPQKQGKNVQPLGNKQAIIPLNTKFGKIKLIIAADEMQ